MNTAEAQGGKSQSVWHATVEVKTFPRLLENLETDVVIIGAGLAGLTTAYLLTKEGKRVVVLDDGPIGGGETGRTTAHLTNEIDDRYYHTEFLHGEEGLKIAAESQTAAIDTIENIVQELNIECNFERVDGYLFTEQNESDKELKKELEAIQRSQISGVELLPELPNPEFKTGPCLRFPRQAQFHPLKYLNALAQAIVKRGGMIFTFTHANAFESAGDAKKNNPVKITTSEKYSVTAGAAVIATNTPVNDWVVIHTKQAAYRTYAIGCEIERGAFPKILLWDTKDPYHYIRMQSNGDKDILIVGGEDHKVGQKDSDDREASKARFDALEQWTREHVSIPFTVRYRWSGQVMEPVDALAYLGKNPGDSTNTYIITGDSGMGMTNTTAGAMIITDLILGRENRWAALYDPSRKTLRAIPEYLKENLNVAGEFVEYVTPGDISNLSKIAPGTGAIVRHGLKKLAAYRDTEGKLFTYSAKCPHLGCIVDWNSVESSWDCPCHGSRFTPKGEVMNGPAISGLTPEKIDTQSQ
jgi:glycine/D-amino acid oxidase-like deaminating enzyme/nitrite reductase/ring-hydroxylating ferredoxin subunit